MSDIVIHAKDLTKVYRLYASPRYRFLDMFGLLRNTAGAYTEHAALGGVSLDIRRGEKVAFIGRNGAGKSTLLKLFTGVIEPTAGTLDVRGKAHALLQIGTGFHPDFSGRENVFAYLAQLGVTGREAEKKYDEIVEFAELEEYIGQPVKTYSSGMAVRLMFSTSTAITPDLLVLDEVLGVGDSYFANKSYERIRQLCDRDGTTLLLVTHDVYSAVKICNRAIWIDRGAVLMDADSPAVVKAYEDSIRQQEEHRMRLRKEGLLREAGESESQRRHLIVEVQGRHNMPQPCPVYLSQIELLCDGAPVSTLALGQDTPEAGPGPHLVREGASWGEPTSWQGRAAVPMNHFGSPFHKATVVLESPVPVAGLEPTRFAVRINAWTDEPCDLVVRAFNGGQTIEFGGLPPSPAGWRELTLQGRVRTGETGADAAGINTTGKHGTGVVVIDGVDLLDARGASTVFVEHGAPLTVAIDYRVQDPAFAKAAQVIVVFYRDGVQTACRLATDLVFDAATRKQGRIRLTVPRLKLGLGAYSVGIMIAEAGYLEREQLQFYTLSDRVYASMIRVLEFTVTGTGLLASNTAWVGEGDWSIDER
jgi:lipopolysaccharide transport system ATP-binding protein